MMYGNAGTRPERARLDGFVSTDQGKVSSNQPVLGTGAWRVVRISPAGLPVGRGRPLAAWAPRTRVRADAHKKIRGKMVKGIAIFGIRNFPTEWCGSEAARRAASISGGAAWVAARR